MDRAIINYYIQELKAEDVSARKCLERIPESTYKFKPHERSMEMGYLVLLVADIPKWLTATIKDSVIDLTTWQRFTLSTCQAMLDYYDQNLKDAIATLENCTEEQLKVPFELKMDGKLLFSAPKLKNIGESINHWVHHRGQLTVYMRLNEIPVPSIYGPSADDKNF